MSKTTKQKATSKPIKRREELRRTVPKPSRDLKSLLLRPGVVSALLMGAVFTFGASLLVIWSREQVKVDVGQIMTDTRLYRLTFEVQDEAQTDKARQEAQAQAQEVFTIKSETLEQLREPLLNLPATVAQPASFEEISLEIRQGYALSEVSATTLAAFSEDGKPTAQWKARINDLIDTVLPRHPLIPSDVWGVANLQRGKQRLEDINGQVVADWDDVIVVSTEGDSLQREVKLRSALEKVITDEVGFSERLAETIAAGIVFNLESLNTYSTYARNAQATQALAEKRAAEVEPIMITYGKGDVIYKRGDRLTGQHLDLLRLEAAKYRAQGWRGAVWGPRIGLIGFVVIITALVGGYVATFYPGITHNWIRLAAIGALLCGMLAITVSIVVPAPKFIYLAAVGPTLLVAFIALLSYDQRIALFLSTTQCVLVTLALQQSIGFFILLLAGCGLVIGQLREVRHRSSLIRAATTTTALVGLGAIMLGALETPFVDGALRQILWNAGLGAGTTFSIGFLVLGILPSIEKMFDITTGMTLAELRDPKQPLLRQLQQRAPGTYNHSLQVANIAEAAAETIGANGLLLYVGALYHDIGKINKPQYFIENQTEASNKHEKLSPAMSLLVIVGHVKDGIELAREYGLPRRIQHFIESHHGTNLVEYFYQAAKTQAEVDEKANVEEIEYRYPGPKPRSREAAILMLADSVESATRSMAEPNPSRIENLVRSLSRGRLVDGQFDQCELTFRELSTIEESIIKSICAIYHSRISYPTAKPAEPDQDKAPAAEPASA